MEDYNGKILTLRDNETGVDYKVRWKQSEPPTEAQMDEMFNDMKAQYYERAVEEVPDFDYEKASKEASQIMHNIYAPVLETAGLVGGGTAGALSGLPAGPAAVATSALGAGLGYGLLKNISDTFDVWLGLKEPKTYTPTGAVVQAGKDVLEGAENYVYGEGIGKMFGFMFRPGAKPLLHRLGGGLTGAIAGGMTAGGKGAAIGAAAGVLTGPKLAELYHGTTPKGAEKEAAKRLYAALGDSDNYLAAANVKEAKAVEKEINKGWKPGDPKLVFNLGHQTDNPSVIMEIRAATKKKGNTKLATEWSNQAAENAAAFERYYNDLFPEDQGMADVMEAVRARQAKLANNIETAKGQMQAATGGLNPTEPDVTGGRVFGALGPAEAGYKSEAGAMYRQLPRMNVGVDGLFSKLDEINTPLHKGEELVNFPDFADQVMRSMGKKVQRDNVVEMVNGPNPIPLFKSPKQAVAFGENASKSQLKNLQELYKQQPGKLKNIKQALEQTKDPAQKQALAEQFTAERQQLGFQQQALQGSQGTHPLQKQGRITPANHMELQDLIGMKQIFGAKGRQAASGATPNRALAKRYFQAADAVSEAIEAAEGTTGSAAMLKRANAFYRENVLPFRQYGLGQIMRKGPTGEPTGMSFSQIPGRLWGKGQLSTADQFIKAVGADNARAIMKDHAAYDLMNKIGAKENITLNMLNTWKSQNGPMLKRFNLENAFDDVFKAQKMVDDARAISKEFEKTVAARLLNMDPETAIGTALGSTYVGKAARELWNVVKGNPAAENGLRKAFGNYAVKKMKDVFDTFHAAAASGAPKIKPREFAKVLNRFKPAEEIFFANAPEKLQALYTMRRGYQIAMRDMQSPIGGGPETAEVLSHIERWNFLNSKITAVKGVIRSLREHGNDMADEYFQHALFEPEYADTLLKGFRGEFSPKEIKEIIDRQMKDMMMGTAEQAFGKVAGAGMQAIGAPGRIVDTQNYVNRALGQGKE